MAVQRRFNCSPEQVFAVLHDGWIYPVWVVNAACSSGLMSGASPQAALPRHPDFH
jgi:hypothetical protein